MTALRNEAEPDAAQVHPVSGGRRHRPISMVAQVAWLSQARRTWGTGRAVTVAFTSMKTVWMAGASAGSAQAAPARA